MRTHALLLWCAATDKTFSAVDLRGTPALAGKCIHCNTTLCIGLDGTPISRATVEHIVPRSAGGTNDLANLAIACARCNGGKGIRHDHKGLGDPGLKAVIETLQSRKAARTRPPLAGLTLPALETNALAAPDEASGENAAEEISTSRRGGRGRGRARSKP